MRLGVFAGTWLKFAAPQATTFSTFLCFTLAPFRLLAESILMQLFHPNVEAVPEYSAAAAAAAGGGTDSTVPGSSATLPPAAISSTPLPNSLARDAYASWRLLELHRDYTKYHATAALHVEVS